MRFLSQFARRVSVSPRFYWKRPLQVCYNDWQQLHARFALGFPWIRTTVNLPKAVVEQGLKILIVHVVLLLLMLAVFAFAAEIPTTPRQIIGGRDTDSREFPAVLYVSDCTGSLIAPQWALTAAHCVIGKQPIGGVRVERGYPEDYESRRSVQVVVHPEYVSRSNSNQNDIALVKFDRPFLSKTVRLQKLANAALEEILLQPGTIAISVGWGQTEKNEHSDILQTAQWPISECPSRGQFDNYVFVDNLFCRTNIPWKSQAYIGDSGGPVLVNHQENWWQVGVHVYRANASIDGTPKLYAIAHTIGPYIEWMEEVIGTTSLQKNAEIEEEFTRLSRRLRDAMNILHDTIDRLKILRLRVRNSKKETR